MIEYYIFGTVILVLTLFAVFFLVKWLMTRRIMKRARTPFAGLDKDASLTDILASFDSTFLTHKVREYKTERKEQKKLESVLKSLLEVTTSEGLLAVLEDLRTDYPGIPVPESIGKLYSEAANSSEKEYQQIGKLLSLVDARMDSHYSTTYDSFVKRVIEYDQLLKSNKAYQAVAQSYRGLLHTLGENGELNFWDRMALIVYTMDRCAIPLLELEGEAGSLKNETLLQNIKNDLILSYLTRYFLKYAADASENGATFREHLSQGIKDALEKYNDKAAKEDPAALIPLDSPYIQEKSEALVDAFIKMYDGREARPFMDKMWTFFVKDFLEKTAGEAPEETYLLGQALNIAFHTADFLDHMVGGRGTEYCYNYAFLLNDLDPVKSGSREYRFQDYSQSTKRSDFVFSCADRLGIQHLKVLVDNYYIKP